MFRKLMSLFYKVDEVTRETDSLNELIYGSRDDEKEYLRKTYGLSPRQCEHLGVMFLKYQDEVLSSFGTRRMERLLDKKKNVLAYYVDFQQLTFLLILYYHPKLECDLLSGCCSK